MHTGKRDSGLLGWWYAVMDGAVAVAEHAAPARGSTPDASRDGGHPIRKEARWRLVASGWPSATPPTRLLRLAAPVSALRFLPPRPLELEQRFQASHCGPPDSQALASHGVGGGGSLWRVAICDWTCTRVKLNLRGKDRNQNARDRAPGVRDRPDRSSADGAQADHS